MTPMEEIQLIEATERYLNGEMSSLEKTQFEETRKNNPEIDQQVVEHIFFLSELEKHRTAIQFKHTLHETFSKLTEQGFIQNIPAHSKPTLIHLWHRYKKTIAVAASIAGIVSIISATLISKLSNQKNSNIKPLVEKLKEQDNKYKKLEKQIGQLNSAVGAQKNIEKPRVESKFRATGFLIDVNNNFIVTNAHVINEAKHKIVIENSKGEQFLARSVFVNVENDLAILQVIDPDFRKMAAIPFNIKKNEVELGEQIFMLGYPKQEIVYNEGYISAKNGYEMDSVFCEISATVNEGNSGSPVINKNGELIGVISGRETNSEGVVFVIKAAYIQKAIGDVKQMNGFEKIKITSNPILRGYDRVSQVKKLQEYVFMIKGN